MTEEKDHMLIEALAEAWASIDGKGDAFRRDKDVPLEHPTNTGSYEGYIAEAEELIARLETRGYQIVRC